MKRLFYLFILLALASCKTPCQKISYLMEKHPECVPIDSTTQTVEIETPEVKSEGKTLITVDSSAVDSLKALLKNCGANQGQVLEQIERFIPYAIKIDPVDTTTKEFHLTISVKNGKLIWENTILAQTHKKEAPLFIQSLIPQGLEADKKEIKSLKNQNRKAQVITYILLVIILALLVAMIYILRSFFSGSFLSKLNPF